VARYEGKNATDTTETARGEARTEKAQLASEEFGSTRKGSRHREFWKSEVLKMGRYEMLSLFIIFGLELSAMWGGLTVLVVLSLRMGGHLNKGGSPSLVEEVVCKPEDHARSGHSSLKSANRENQLPFRATSADPQEE
jgi:hypothetical protein